MSNEQLLDSVKSWINIDNEIRQLQTAIKERRKQKKELTENLVNTMKQNDIDVFNIPDGELIYTKTRSKTPLSKKHLLLSLSEYFKDNKEMVDQLGKFILDSRKIKEKENIKRKIKK
jgi:RNase adaptor protein for sRNA GlmZ degradation